MEEFFIMSFVFSISSLNYFFLRMWHVLHGKWWRISPTWRWLQDIAELKRLAKSSESEKLRQECNVILWGLYITAGFMLFLGIVGFILTKMDCFRYP